MEIAIIIIIIQIFFLLWFIETLQKIKIYLRDIRDMMQDYNRER